MKINRRFKGIVLTAIMILSACFGTIGAGCGKNDEGIDPNRTQLDVGFFEGGWGREWLDEMINMEK